MIGWYVKNESRRQITLTDAHNQPFKYFDSQSHEYFLTPGNLFYGKMTKIHPGGAFVDIGDCGRLFLRRPGKDNIGKTLLVQVQKSWGDGLDSDKAPRSTTEIVLENYFWIYRPQHGDMTPKLTAQTVDKDLLDAHADTLRQDYAAMQDMTQKPLGLAAAPLTILQQACLFPVQKFFTNDSHTALTLRSALKKLNLPIGVEMSRETAEILSDAVEARAQTRHTHQGVQIIIEPTHALCAIDVNSASGQFTAQSPETIALEVNRLIVPLLLRLLRLQDITGRVVIDFITMRQARSRQKLLRHIKTEAGRQAKLLDTAPPTMHGWTRAGLFELQMPANAHSFSSTWPKKSTRWSVSKSI